MQKDDDADQSGDGPDGSERDDGTRLLLQALMEANGTLNVHTPMFQDPQDMTLHVAAWRVLSRSLGQEICLRSGGRLTEAQALQALVDELKDECKNPSAEIDTGSKIVGLDGKLMRPS